MSVHHHPSDEILISYAAGALSEGWSLLVATHLALCPACRGRSRSAEAVGGFMLDCEKATPLEAAAFEAVMARITNEKDPHAACARIDPCGGALQLPQPLRAYAGGDLGDLRWRRLGLAAARIPIRTADRETRVQLIRFPPGMEVPRHGHGGRELTLILCGSLRDGDIVYRRGDMAEADEGVDHAPKAGPETGCVCLVATDAPVRFHSLALRLAQPLLGI